ncbi:hypothetical protein C0Q70_08395 [Pomacea canaliculata]|uniref:Uncharacterized protein n=1 Tax=Pomacea canaliculata TaxID=400727 RepID=A0A2T7PHQ1_POMCA|nr:hypothetical protein C0Q70_08395 [Pomacea canaliculata]
MSSVPSSTTNQPLTPEPGSPPTIPPSTCGVKQTTWSFLGNLLAATVDEALLLCLTGDEDKGLTPALRSTL